MRRGWVFALLVAAAGCVEDNGYNGTVREVSTAAAAKLLGDDNTLSIIDLRTASEFAGGHIAGAQNLDYRSPDFSRNLRAMDMDTAYLIHCASGGRSSQALVVFERLGFKRIYHMKEGMNGWRVDGRPVEQTPSGVSPRSGSMP